MNIFKHPLLLRLALPVVLISLCCQLPVHAQSGKFSLSGGGIVNVNNFNWSIAGNIQGQAPNILSELRFRQITSAGAWVGGYYAPVKQLHLGLYYQRNGVTDGKGTDTDYKDDNRANPTFQQPFSSNKGYLDIFMADARFIFLQRANFNLGAGVFYKNTRQHFVLLSPELTDLQSSYAARWRGPGLSATGNYMINRNISVGASAAYSILSYSGEANWNLIDIFMHPLSFAHTAKGHGMDYDLKLVYTANTTLSFLLAGMLGNMHISKGTDVAYLKNGMQSSTQFNGSGNTSYGIRLGAVIQL